MGEMTREEVIVTLLRHGVADEKDAAFWRRNEHRFPAMAVSGHLAARRLSALEKVVEAARQVSDASLSMAAATSGGAAKLNVQGVVEAAGSMDAGWVALDTALAALDEKEVGNG